MKCLSVREKQIEINRTWIRNLLCICLLCASHRIKKQNVLCAFLSLSFSFAFVIPGRCKHMPL
jgi:hypothetical protein